MRRSLSIIMAMLMIVGIMPAAAFAEDAEDVIVLPEATACESYLQHIVNIEDNYPVCEIADGSLPEGIGLYREMNENEKDGYWFLEGEATQVGTYRFEIEFTYEDATEQKAYELTVNDKIIEEVIVLPEATVAESYLQHIVDIKDNYPVCEIASGSLPEGIGLYREMNENEKDGYWFLEGEATQVGTYQFEIKFTYEDAAEQKKYELTVNDNIILEPVQVLTSYGKTIAPIEGGYPKCEISGGELPMGLALKSELDESGEAGSWMLFGELLEMGEFVFEVKFTYEDSVELKHYKLTVEDVTYLEEAAYQIYEDFGADTTDFVLSDSWQVVSDEKQAHSGYCYVTSNAEGELTSPAFFTNRNDIALTWYDKGDAGESYSVYLTNAAGEITEIGSFEANEKWTIHRYTLERSDNVTVTFKHNSNGNLSLDLITVSKGYDTFGGVLKNAFLNCSYSTEIYRSNTAVDAKILGYLPGGATVNEHIDDDGGYIYTIDGTFETRGTYEFYVEFTRLSGGTEIVKFIIGVHDIVQGDVNEDGVINTADAVTVLKYAAYMIELSESQMGAADVNCDNVVNTADAVEILKYAANA